MKDLISRQAVIDLLKQMRKDGDMVPWEGKDVFARIRNLPSAQPEQRWIPCSERLPDAECGESDIVLATCGYMNVKDTSVRWIKTLYFNGGNWCCPTGGTYEQKVYAWMPLPEPYREVNRMDDLISRQAVLKLLSTMPPEEAITKAMLIQNVKYMSAAQPDEEKISDTLYNIYRQTSPHTSAEGVAAIKYYIAEIWREIYGEEGPRWMRK